MKRSWFIFWWTREEKRVAAKEEDAEEEEEEEEEFTSFPSFLLYLFFLRTQSICYPSLFFSDLTHLCLEVAVEAQYQSNVLLFNRNEQKRKDMELSLQFQAAEFLDQSTNVFSHGGISNGKNKRGRTQEEEEEEETNPPLHTLVNLPQLHTSQTTLGLGQNHQQQQDEIDQFLRAQGHHLRRTFAESGKRHYHTMLALAEESAARRLREKEVEVENVARRNAKLEVSIARLRAELMAWQEKAQAEKAAAATLQAQLQEVAGAAQKQDWGAEPGCVAKSAAAATTDVESAYVDPERRRVGPAVCRACWGRAVSVVLLPCRHLCLCRECAGNVQTCPICHCVRSACVEVYLS